MKKLYENGLVADPNKTIGKNRREKKYKSKVVKKLEREANRPVKKRFKFSKVMCEELESYIEQYGDDYEAMARDKKNIYQDSPGQLRYKILKFKKLNKQK